MPKGISWANPNSCQQAQALLVSTGTSSKKEPMPNDISSTKEPMPDDISFAVILIIR